MQGALLVFDECEEGREKSTVAARNGCRKYALSKVTVSPVSDNG